MNQTIPLHKLKKGSKLIVHVLQHNEYDGEGTEKYVEEAATFHHIDGMYSLCTIDSRETENTFHLSAITPMILRPDGKYEIFEEAV